MARITLPIPLSPVRSSRGAAGTGESISIALDSLRANKLRTFLTMLGIIIGVWSVVSLLSLGNGAQRAITDQVRGIGTNLLNVFPGIRPRNTPRQYVGIAPPLTLADADAIGRSIPEVVYVAPEYQREAQIVVGSLNRGVKVIGVTSEYGTIRGVDVADGQFLTDEMVRAVRPAAVLGANLAEDLFGASDPIGQTVRIKGELFTVVGYLQPSGLIGGYDGAVFVPLTTVHQTLFGDRDMTSGSYQVSNIWLQAESAADVDLVQSEVERILRQRHRLPDDGSSDDFTVFSQASLLSTYDTITTTLTAFLGAIAGISLLVGGIGVMNIMLVSVSERTREIGLRKAVGAKRRHILQQFLVEAAVMSIIGGIVGFLLGYATVIVVNLFFSDYIQPIIAPWMVFMALGFSVAVGLFFGIYPARRAARLDPIQALRFE